MPTYFAHLKREAREATRFRGHRLGRFRTTNRTNLTAIAQCAICGMDVAVKLAPAPNGVAIAGEAVALHCSAPQDRSRIAKGLRQEISGLSMAAKRKGLNPERVPLIIKLQSALERIGGERA